MKKQTKHTPLDELSPKADVRKRHAGCDSAFRNRMCISPLHNRPVQPVGKVGVLRFDDWETLG